MCLNEYIKKLPLEYCAARFLRQWESREENLYTSISQSPSTTNVTEALGYFQVARSFEGVGKNVSVQEKVLYALIGVKNNSSLITPESKVTSLAETFKRDFSKFNISSASKLLWLSYREPYVIYDKRAVNTLKKLKHKNIEKNYHNYFSAWKNQFSELERSIESAIKNLPSGRNYLPYMKITDAEIQKLSGELWFKERVFDIFLWELNGQG